MRRPRLCRLLLPPLLVGLMASCAGGTTGPAFSEDGFSIRAGLGRLVLRNGSPAPIHYVAIEQETAALVDLHYDPETWPKLEPGEEEVIPYPELMGWEPGATHAIVYWWTAGEYADPVVVRLR